MRIGFKNLVTMALVLLLGAACPGALDGQSAPPACEKCVVWNTPQAPFRVYGNTYYVGPHGLSSILIASDAGLVLIDGALAESVPQIVANIHTLGFRIEDVKLILNSHAHFDHAGGIAELQRLSGAEVVVSEWSAKVMTTGSVVRGDPQYGSIPPIARVARVRTLHDGGSFRLSQLVLTAHLTPGHTPGGTSWTWKSCEDGRCLEMVYADSLSPVSTPGFKFTQSREYPGAIADFEKSFAFLSAVPCDILLTPHGEASNLWERVDARERGVTPDPMIDPSLCGKLADSSREQLRKRIASETGH
jgi:metallo-beta-lactamase class B